MIKNFKHKGLKKLFIEGESKKINPDHKRKIKRLMLWLNNIQDINDVGNPNFGLHRLKGDLDGMYSINVSGNYRLVFSFSNGDIFDLDYLDYH